MNRNTTRQPCANPECPRPASPGEVLCETCGLEKALYRREERGGPWVDRAFRAALERLDRIPRQPD